MSMNMIDVYIKTRPIRAGLSFGINKNVIFNGLDIKERRTKADKDPMFNGYLSFAKTEEDKIIANTEYSFFNLSADNLVKTEDSFDKQLNKYLDIAYVLYPDEKSLDDAITAAILKVYGEDGGDIDSEADKLFAYNSKTLKKKHKITKKDLTSMVMSLQKHLNEVFNIVLNEKAGIKKSPKFYLLNIVDSGGYSKLPFNGAFISKKDDLLIDPYYIKLKAESEKAKKPDDIDEDIEDDGEDNTEDEGLDDVDKAAGSIDKIIKDSEEETEGEETEEETDEDSDFNEFEDDV